MAEIDLPPISFQRYLDLLKRRKWQVVPLSILGLLIGGIVAFLIPRYYVAQTTIEYNGTFIRVDLGRDDPIAGALGLAKNTLPYFVPDVLQKLRWPEVMTEDRSARRSFERKVRDRVTLEDIGSQEKGRTSTQLRLSYRDTDGQRAADLANALRDHWKERTQQDISEGFERSFAKLQEALDKVRTNITNIRNERARFEQDNKIDPQLLRANKDRGETQRSERMRETQNRIDALKARIRALETQIPGLRLKLEDTSMYLTAAERRRTAAEQHRLDEATNAVIRADNVLKGVYPAHQNYTLYVKALETARANLRALESGLETGGDVKQELNPAWEEAQRKLREAERERLEKQQELAAEEANLVQIEKELEKLPTVYQDYDAILERLARAEKELESLDKERVKAETNQRNFVNQQPFRIIEPATIPDRPTEPNITLVALGGCALGLALAIVMILAIDMLRSTFKTVDDVERGVPVPVLGSLSHMETKFERELAQRKRTRASIVAGALLTLVVAIVTIYYVAPARLPSVVTKALGYVLGAGK